MVYLAVHILVKLAGAFAEKQYAEEVEAGSCPGMWMPQQLTYGTAVGPLRDGSAVDSIPRFLRTALAAVPVQRMSRSAPRTRSRPLEPQRVLMRSLCGEWVAYGCGRPPESYSRTVAGWAF